MPDEPLGVNQVTGNPPPPEGTVPPEGTQIPPADGGPPHETVVSYDRFKEVNDTNKTLGEQNRTLQQELELRRQQDIAREIATRNAPPPQPAEKVYTDEELDNMALENPAKAMRIMVNQREKALLTAIPRLIAGSKQQETIATTRETTRRDMLRQYPDLTNPQSEFAREVANVLAENPDYYQHPKGLRLAVNEAIVKLGPDKVRQQVVNEELQRQTVPGVEGGGAPAPAAGLAELDAQGLAIANKLGIDPKVMAQRLLDKQRREGGR